MTATPRHVYLYIALGVAAVSTSAIFVKLSETPPVVLAFYRVLLASVLLAPVLVRREWDSFRRTPGRDAALAVVSGVFLALHYAVWFFSLQLTSVASSTVLVTTQPIWVMLIAYVLWRERVPLPSLAGIALALVGVYFIGSHSAQQGESQLLGDVLAVAAAILVSGYLLIGQRLRARMPLLTYVVLVYGAAAVVLGLLAVVLGLPFTGYGAREWAIYLGLAAVPTLLGHTVFNWALQHVPASVVSVSILGEPVGTVLLAMLVLGEVPAPAQVLAGLVILTGIGIFLHYRSRRAASPRLAPGGAGGLARQGGHRREG